MADTPPQLSAGIADRYRIERELGRGGMGAVYLANDIKLDRLVALKVLPPEFAGDASLRERFLRETRTAASFSHPNIVPVFSVEEGGDSIAFVMGFVEGESLAARVARSGPLDVRSLVRMLQDVAYALSYAHGRGVVHRDIKPDNIMIERATGRALVMDFGIARAMTPAANKPGLTRVGEVVGTPEYMSPEQSAGDNLDGRSDLYSLGLVAQFAITGRTPITGDSAQQIIIRQLTEQLPPTASLRTDIPAALAAAIDLCVAKDPAHRLVSAEALIEAIDAGKLAGPEIPLPIRLFAQELGTVGLLAFFMALLSYVIVLMKPDDTSTLDILLPLTLVVGAVFGRFVGVYGSAVRLGGLGFAVGDVMAGMRSVIEEKAGVRAAAYADPALRARRRATVMRAAIMLILGPAMARIAWGLRVQIGPHMYRTGYLGIVLAFGGFTLFALGAMLLLRSPFRTPVNDRAFKAVWLGPIGRLFLRIAIRRKGDASDPTTSPRNALVPRPAPQKVATAAARVAAPVTDPNLDARLDRIETMITRLAERLDEPK